MVLIFPLKRGALLCYGLFRASWITRQHAGSLRLPSPLFLSTLHRHEEALVRLLALHLPGQADKYRAKVPNSTGKETLPVSFGRDWIHHFSKITHCAEKGKRLKNKHLVRESEE